jgi:hypothetical protein
LPGIHKFALSDERLHKRGGVRRHRLSLSCLAKYSYAHLVVRVAVRNERFQLPVSVRLPRVWVFRVEAPQPILGAGGHLQVECVFDDVKRSAGVR